MSRNDSGLKSPATWMVIAIVTVLSSVAFGILMTMGTLGSQSDSQPVAFSGVDMRPVIDVISDTEGIAVSVIAKKASRTRKVSNMEVQHPDIRSHLYLTGLPSEGEADAYLIVRGSPGQEVELELHLREISKLVLTKKHEFELDKDGIKTLKVRYSSNNGKKRMSIN